MPALFTPFKCSGARKSPWLSAYSKWYKSNCELYGEWLSFEQWHVISYNVVCVTSKTSDQPVHRHSLIRAFASHLIFYDC